MLTRTYFNTDIVAREALPHNVLHSSSNNQLVHKCMYIHVSAQYFSIVLRVRLLAKWLNVVID